MALISFFAAEWKCAARDQWIGWSYRYQYDRLHLIANNSRFLILPSTITQALHPAFFPYVNVAFLRIGSNASAKLMRDNGLRAIAAKKYKATTNHTLPVAPNLLEQNFTADVPAASNKIFSARSQCLS
ncbi:MAG: Druantia anti-phage system protein DruA [Methylomonas sp.]